MTLAETVDLIWRLSSSQSRSVGLFNQDVQAMDVARYAPQGGSLPRGRCLLSPLAGNKGGGMELGPTNVVLVKTRASTLTVISQTHAWIRTMYLQSLEIVVIPT